jgi:small GTP-binding protein
MSSKASRDAKNQNFDTLVKILMLGNSAVGKTWLLIRYSQEIEPSSSIATIGIDFKVKFVSIEGSRLKLQIWDTAGAERFHSLTTSVYRNAHGVVLIYDLTERPTFKSIEAWITQIHRHADTNINIVLVGNKCDVAAEEREVSIEEGQELTDKFEVPFFEASAKKNINVENIFLRLGAEVKHRLAREAVESPSKSKKQPLPGLKASAEDEHNGKGLGGKAGGCC